MQERGGGHRHVAAEAGADQHQVAAELLAEVHQPRDARARLVDAAVVDRVRVVAFRARNFRQRGDLAPPGTGFLAVGEHHVAGITGACMARVRMLGRLSRMRE